MGVGGDLQGVSHSDDRSNLLTLLFRSPGSFFFQYFTSNPDIVCMNTTPDPATLDRRRTECGTDRRMKECRSH